MKQPTSQRGLHTPSTAAGREPGEPRLFEQFRAKMRVKHYSLRTEQAYWYWIRRFILAMGKRHPRELDGVAVQGFVSRLAAPTFVYKHVLGSSPT